MLFQWLIEESDGPRIRRSSPSDRKSTVVRVPVSVLGTLTATIPTMFEEIVPTLPGADTTTEVSLLFPRARAAGVTGPWPVPTVSRDGKTDGLPLLQDYEELTRRGPGQTQGYNKS